MKVNKKTGLVPATYLKNSNGYSVGESGGLTPADFKRLKGKGIVEFNSKADDADLFEVDDDSFVAVPLPSLGGYDHEAPLAFRHGERGGAGALPGRVATYEDPELGRRGVDSAEARPASTAQEAIEKASGQHDGKTVDEVGQGEGEGEGEGQGEGENEATKAPAAAAKSGGKQPPAPPKSGK